MHSPEVPLIRPRRIWLRRAGFVLAAIALAATPYVLYGPRRPSLPLRTWVDGPSPASASAVIVFLHGRGSTIARIEWLARALRDAGLGSDVAIALVEAPFSTGLGHSWGDSAAEQATSRARLRARLAELLGTSEVGRKRLVIAGFSQGAGMAIDLAVEEPRISALASFSPCYSHLRGELPKRDRLRVLLAHGARDTRCPVIESRSLAQVLKEAHRQVEYIEFDGAHTIPPEVVRALAALTMAP